jgi:hypothetical protein
LPFVCHKVLKNPKAAWSGSNRQARTGRPSRYHQQAARLFVSGRAGAWLVARAATISRQHVYSFRVGLAHGFDKSRQLPIMLVKHSNISPFRVAVLLSPAVIA